MAAVAPQLDGSLLSPQDQAFFAEFGARPLPQLTTALSATLPERPCMQLSCSLHAPTP